MQDTGPGKSVVSLPKGQLHMPRPAASVLPRPRLPQAHKLLLTQPTDSAPTQLDSPANRSPSIVTPARPGSAAAHSHSA
jgi:hypothetical protein